MNFATGLEQYGDRPALLTAGAAAGSVTALSYAELAARADAVFARADAPPSPRCVVAIEADNGVDALAGYLGALRRGQPALLIDAALAAALRTGLYDHYGIAWIWRADGSWQGPADGAGDGPAAHPCVALLLSTSGSTGAPKLVRLSMDNLQANAASIAAYLEIDERERPITTLPFHYSYGMSVLNSHLARGAAIVLTAEPVTARGFWDLFRAAGATSLAGVPTTYTLLRQLRFERMALPTLRTLTQAGGRLPEQHVQWFAELARARGQRFVVMYGQTEAAPRIAWLPSDAVLEKPGAIGIAIPGGQLDLLAEDGTIIEAAGTVGELRYRGPNVMLGYAQCAADLAAPDRNGGVLMTGDLAERDADGYYYVRGRRSRFIKVFGNRIGLDEVESQLRAKGYDVAVTGRDDLMLVALRGDAARAAELAAALPGWYRLHHSALRVAAVSEFPLSSAGKLQYAALLAQLAPQPTENT